MSATIQNQEVDKQIKQLCEDILQYCRTIMNDQEDTLIPSQCNLIESASINFRILTQTFDTIIDNIREQQLQYQLLEKQLIEKESEIRKHFQTEQQLKLYAESLMDSIEGLEKQISKLNSSILEKTLENNKLKKYNKEASQPSQERLLTDPIQDRILISRQKSSLEVPYRYLGRKISEFQKLKLVQNNTIERIQEIQNIYSKKVLHISKQRSKTVQTNQQCKQQTRRQNNLSIQH